jgi:hypothetical protein
MDQAEIPPESIMQETDLPPNMTVAPPLEGAFAKYMREYRLLNSLLFSLFVLVGAFAAMWNIVVYVAAAGEGSSDFSDAGTAPADQQQEKQKVVKLMQRQQKSQPNTQQQFRTTAVSDISLPDLNELDVKDLAPVVEAAAPTMAEVGSNSDQMKKAMAGIGLSLPKVMQQRCDPKKRLARLREGGGKEITEDAIVKGLMWLKNNQDSDGGWGDNDKTSDGKRPGYGASHKHAMTGMALLAFLGHCELQDSPQFGPTVQKAIDFLTSQPPDQMIGSGGPAAYCHGIRTYALCEAYTMTKIPKLKEYAKRAASFMIKGQNENGGWAYGFGKGPVAHTDLSVTGWCIQGLKAAALTGIPIEGLDESMDKAIEYVKKCQADDGKFKYKMDSGPKSSLTGTGILCLQIWKNAKSAEAKKGLDWIEQNISKNDSQKEWKNIDIYGWYYHAQACFQATGAGGDKYWRAWNRDFQKIVTKAQSEDGNWKSGKHFHGDTEIYCTTMTILMLEVYYRYMPSTKV